MNLLQNTFDYYRDNTNRYSQIVEYISKGVYHNLDLSQPSQLYTAFERVLHMTNAYAYANDTSHLNENLLTNICNNLGYLSSYYNKKSKQTGNWWYWRIGIPNLLLKTLAILEYYQVDKRYTKRDIYKEALDRFVYKNTNTDMTYANLASICRNVLMMYIVYGDDKYLVHGLKDATPAFEKKSPREIKMARWIQKLYVKAPCLPYNIKMFAGKEGLYDDYSFIQHTSIPYLGTYGLEIFEYAAFVSTIFHKEGIYLDDKIISVLPEWLKAADFVLYDGQVLLPYCGRSVETIDTVHQASVLKKYISEIIASRPELFPENKSHFAFVQSNSDVAMLDHSDWRFIVKMSSDRIARYEYFLNQNKNGRHQGEGMTYLYLKGSDEYKNGYFKRMNPDELPGVSIYSYTSDKTSEQPRFDYTKDEIDNLYAGGVTAKDGIALATMASPNFKKSWAFVTDMIVTSGYVTNKNIERTTVDNKLGKHNIYVYKNNNWEQITEAETTLSKSATIYVEGVGCYKVIGKRIYINTGDNGYNICVEHSNCKYTYYVLPLCDRDEALNKIKKVSFINNDDYQIYTLKDTNKNVRYSMDFNSGVASVELTEQDTQSVYISNTKQDDSKCLHIIIDAGEKGSLIHSPEISIEPNGKELDLLVDTNNAFGKTFYIELKK